MSESAFGRLLRHMRHGLLAAIAGIALIQVASSFNPAVAANSNPGPCDLYAAGGTPCVAAHSTTRAMYAAFGGPLYQVVRSSDKLTRDIRPLVPGGYADAASQDSFCAGTTCSITVIYDQSGRGNHLTQAPPGPTYQGPAAGGHDTLADATAAPISIGGGHRAYGVYIPPGTGYRNNKADGTAVGDQAEGQYAVFDGTHYNGGCCFDYGNAETNSGDNGAGTMEAIYFGSSSQWGSGSGPGPWVMADMENGVFSGLDRKFNAGGLSIKARFVTAILNGGPNLWALKGGDAQQGPLTTFYSGVRPTGWNPMKKEGAIILGTGGDNSNSSAGTFYEGAMTAGYPSEATDAAVQANIIAARYMFPDTSLRLTGVMPTFQPGQTQTATAVFTNNSDTAATGVKLGLPAPSGWSATATTAAEFTTVAPGKTVTTTFRILAPAAKGASSLRLDASYKARGASMTSATTQKVKVAFPIKINELRLGVIDATTNQFIELFNSGAAPVDISGYRLVFRGSTEHCCRLTTIGTIPGDPGSGATTLAGGAYYLLGRTGGYTGAPTPNQMFTASLASRFGAPGGAIALLDPATATPGLDPPMLVVDSVAFGATATNTLGEGPTHDLGCYPAAPAIAALPGNSLARIPNGQDTDFNCADFVVSSVPTPGAANIPSPPRAPGRGGGPNGVGVPGRGANQPNAPGGVRRQP